MNMSMDKPIALSSTEGARGPQVKILKMRFPELGNYNMNMSMDKPIALSSTEGIRGPQVKKNKNSGSQALGVKI